MRKRKSNLLSILVLLLLGIGLGYALLSQDLTINGTTKVKGNNWSIHFDNVQISSGSVTLSTGDSAAEINSNDDTLVEYTVTLNTPGDFYEFTVDAVNDGTVDGMIGEIVSKYNGDPIDEIENPLPSYIGYSVTYSDGVAISNNHILAVNGTETYKVRVEFLRDIENDELPTTDQTLTFSFGVNYIQRTGNGVAVPHPFSGSGTKYMANMYPNTVYIGQMIPYQLTLYDTAAEARADLTEVNGGTNVPFSLKHTIVNGIVTESYVEFVVTSEMATANPEMTAGTYALRGFDTYDEVNDDCVAEYWDSTNNICLSPYYATNVATLQTAFGASNCTDNTTSYICSVSGLEANAYSYGNVHAIDGGSFICNVYSNGASYCNDHYH